MRHTLSRPNFFVCQQDNENSPSILEQSLSSAGCRTTIFKRFERRNSPSFDPTKHTGLILLGGGCKSAHQRGAYAKEKDWIHQALDYPRPILGICLGAQLLVDVYRGPKGERGRVRPGLVRDGEHGWQRVILTREAKRDPVLRHLAPATEMLLAHQDWCELPADGVNLAYSASSGPYSEAFRLGNGHTYGVQFHPEVTKQILKEWIAFRSGRKWNEAMKKTEERSHECFPASSAAGQKLLGAWERLALGLHS